MIVPAVVQQHADDAVAISTARKGLTSAPYAKLARLLRADRRLAANLDGLRIAGTSASSIEDALLERPWPGTLFVLTVLALEQRRVAKLEHLMTVAQAMPQTADGVLGAFGWVEPSGLQGTVASFLRNSDGHKRMIGVATCAAHRVDPGIVSRLSRRRARQFARARLAQLASWAF